MGMRMGKGNEGIIVALGMLLIGFTLIALLKIIFG